MLTKTLGAVCVVTSLAAAPARADDFCAGLTKVLDATAGGFASIKGPADDFIPDWYAGTVAVAGAKTCVVDASGGENAVSYFCEWPEKDAAAIADAYARVVQQTEACVAGATRATEADRTIWRKPRAWTITVSHHKVMTASPGALTLLVAAK